MDEFANRQTDRMFDIARTVHNPEELDLGFGEADESNDDDLLLGKDEGFGNDDIATGIIIGYPKQLHEEIEVKKEHKMQENRERNMRLQEIKQEMVAFTGKLNECGMD